jgi:hypothetical protein
MSTLYFENTKFWAPNEYDDVFVTKGATRIILDRDKFSQAKDLKPYWYKHNGLSIKLLGDVDGESIFIKYGISPNELTTKQWERKKHVGNSTGNN